MNCVHCDTEHKPWVNCPVRIIQNGITGSGKVFLVSDRNIDPKKATGELKPQLQLIPSAFLVEVALALKWGQKKHGPWNWRENRVEMMTYLGASLRHLLQVIEREDLDDRDSESLAHHLGCSAAGMAIVLDSLKQGTLVDNRPPSNIKPNTPP